MFAKILDWEQIPDNLLEYDIDKIKQNHDASPFKEFDLFRQYTISDKNLLSSIQKYFDFDVYGNSYYQLIKNGIPIHIDVDREIIYNYLLKTGGDKVETVWYDDDKITETYRIQIPQHTWHSLDVSTNHTVLGITDTRIAITVHERKT